MGDKSSADYVAGFYNGDVKLYDGQKHTEKLSLTNLLQGDGDSEISDLLWFHSEKLAKRILVACSGSETAPALSVMQQTSTSSMYMEIMGRATNATFTEEGCSVPTCLA